MLIAAMKMYAMTLDFIKMFPVCVAVIPVDVKSSAGRGLDPSGGDLLPGAGAAQLPAQDPFGRDPPVGVQAPLHGGHPPPSQRPALPPHLRHQPTQAPRDPFRLVPLPYLTTPYPLILSIICFYKVNLRLSLILM